jgi:hypothetical protein
MESTPGSSRSRRQSRLPGPSRAHQPSAPFTPLATPPAAPRRSRHSVLVYSPDSTPSTPSLSAPPPFDWDAARNNLDPPFPLVGTANSANIAKVSPVRGRLNSMRKRIFRQSSIVQRSVSPFDVKYLFADFRVWIIQSPISTVKNHVRNLDVSP